MNNKLLSGVLLVGIATTGFAGYSSANMNGTGSELRNNSEIKELFKKEKTGETLTSAEQTILSEAKEKFEGKRGKKMGKRKGMTFLSDEEKASLESMTDEEKQVFFETKKAQREVERAAYRAIISKLLDGETISEEEKATLEEKQAEHEARHANSSKSHENDERGSGKTIITKLIAGETLTDDETALLTEMKEKRAARDAIQALIEKKKAGEDLSEAEQEQLDVFKSEHKGKKGKKGRHKRGEK